MANIMYNSYGVKIQSGLIDLTGDTIKVALVTSSYTPDMDSHTAFSDITNEISGTGYTAGGATLGTITVTQDNTNDRAVFDAADTSWTSSSLTARGAVVYKDSGVDSTSWLISYKDFTSDQISSNGTFEIQWDADGIAYLQMN